MKTESTVGKQQARETWRVLDSEGIIKLRFRTIKEQRIIIDMIPKMILTCRFKIFFLGKQMWPLMRKRTLTVFRLTAEAVGYSLGTRWKRLLKRWRRWENRWHFSFTRWRRWEKPLKKLFQSVASVSKSRWVFFPYPLKGIIKLRFRTIKEQRIIIDMIPKMILTCRFKIFFLGKQMHWHFQRECLF